MTTIRTVEDFVAMFGGTGQAAEWLGVTPSYVSNMLARGYLPTGFHMKAVLEIEARGYRVDPEFFDLKGKHAERFAEVFPTVAGNVAA
jgi:hypothetical protein